MNSEIELLHRMVGIPSPSRQEAELAEFLVKAAYELGLQASVDEVGNLIAETGTGHGPAVLMLSHLDTVDDPIPARLMADRIVGRGAVDAKGSLAAMLVAAAARREFPGRLVVCGAVQEEVPGSLGATHLRHTFEQPDAVIIGEPSGWSNVVLGYKGILELTYRVSRPATHSTNPAEKATEAAAAFWADAVAVLGPEATHASFAQPAATLLRMSGDIAHAVLEFSYRLPPGFDCVALVEKLRGLARGGEIGIVGGFSAVQRPRRDPVVRALTAGIRMTGGAPGYRLKTATSDMNTVGEVWDMPMAAYGPGDSHLDHAEDEHLLIDEYQRGIAVLTAALDELATTLLRGTP